MQSRNEMRKGDRGQFDRMYKVLCREQCSKPLSIVEANSQESSLRFCVDRVDLKDWPPILNAIAKNRSLSKIHVCSRTHCKKIREHIDSEEKLVKLGRCREKDRSRPMFYTNFLVRCLVDAIAVHAGNSGRLVSIVLDGIPLSSRYLDILCSGLADNRNLRDLSLSRCQIGDAGCNLVLGSVRRNPKLSTLNLASCRLTAKSATFILLFFKKKDKCLMENSKEIDTGKMNGAGDSTLSLYTGLHTLILDKNCKFGNEGAEILVPIIVKETSLQLLSLRDCGITREGGDMIVKFSSRNRALSVDLFENNSQKIILRKLSKQQKEGKLVTTNVRLHKGDKAAFTKVHKGSNTREHDSTTMRKQFSKRMETNKTKSPVQLDIQKLRAKVFTKKSKNRNQIGCIETGDLLELELQLSQTQEFNSELQKKLIFNLEQLEHEKHQRAIAEKAYEEVKLKIKNLKRKKTTHCYLHSKMLGENQLIGNIRTHLNDFTSNINLDMMYKILMNNNNV